jgi:hypothetical protein
MTDTPLYIHQKQLEIFLSKPIEERFRLGMEMMDDMKCLIEEGIRSKTPGITPAQLKIEVFKKMYKDDLPEAYISQVVKWMESLPG